MKKEERSEHNARRRMNKVEHEGYILYEKIKAHLEECERMEQVYRLVKEFDSEHGCVIIPTNNL